VINKIIILASVRIAVIDRSNNSFPSLKQVFCKFREGYLTSFLTDDQRATAIAIFLNIEGSLLLFVVKLYLVKC
jgi:hypothetical protein